MRLSLQIILGVLVVLLASVTGKAGDTPTAPNKLGIVITTDCWSELKACG
ncbi:MAG: hypothetical protein HZB25_07845 [Candidatus Eisenbacteria bacterium]|nr:hypothetical protein [Candidatus Eisenbacteria bacterium]